MGGFLEVWFSVCHLRGNVPDFDVTPRVGIEYVYVRYSRYKVGITVGITVVTRYV